jgi:hypothetical protein
MLTTKKHTKKRCMKKTVLFTLLLLQGLFFADLSAQESTVSDTSSVMISGTSRERIGFGIGFKAGTFGPGGEVIVAITPRLHVRVGGSYLHYSLPKNAVSFDDVQILNSLVLGGYSLQLNYHIARPIYITGGAYFNRFEMELEGIPTGTYMIGDIEASPEQVGTLGFKVNPGLKISPYAGLGFGRSLARNGIVSFAFEVGALYHGAPDVTLTASGMLTPTASAEQEATLEKNLSFFTIYPMVNFQLSIRIL